ncbi:hypothetical protein P9273_09535 [Mesorhizobium sp. WSM4935]|uniref:hypothetical protein n=1 Tax=Mesorhizobium sp. WSM4935 TaxID=3038547 RepID=UPI0024150180|nr:hypothetical protein [Mesorhizobium sp. WSM4935]MDG4875337.1 hypothetical protein [Mesorhizobium sp. WSM4935]
MLWRRCALIAFLGVSVAWASGIGLTHSQAAPAVPDIEIEQSITSATGYDTNAVEVASNEFQIVVAIVNSDLNGPLITHRDREAEAAKIVEAIVAVLKGNPAYEKLLAIHIDYVSREPQANHSHVVDAVDYRRNLNGSFDLHRT